MHLERGFKFFKKISFIRKTMMHQKIKVVKEIE